MTRQDLIPVENEGMMEEVAEVELCLVCCSKVKNEDDHLNNNTQLSSNLIVFYLLRRLLQVTGIELKKNLISCGNPVEWISLCDKCSELTRQAEELNRKLKKIERELNCIQQLIWDKAESSIDSEADTKLVGSSTDLTKKTSHIWRRLRNHVAYKCNLRKGRSGFVGMEPLTNPFIEGDKLANYLITQNPSTTAILPSEHSKHSANDENDQLKLLEETQLREATSSLSFQPSLEIKTEVKSELDLEAPLPEQDQNENLLIDSLLVELEEGNEFSNNDALEKEVDVFQEEMEVDVHGGGDQDQLMHQKEQLNNEEEGDGEDEDWNWEPANDEDDEVDEDDHDNEEEEEVDDEEDGEDEEKKLEDLLEKIREQGTSSTANASATKWEKGKQMPKVKVKGPPTEKKSRLIAKPILTASIKTEDGKFKCRHCDKTFARLTGCNGHEREKHSKTPGNFACDICARTFNSRDYLRKHIKYAHELKFDADGKPRKRSLKIIRTNDGKFKCRHCDQTFACQSTASAHEHNKHSETPGGFICDICGKAFNSVLYLRGHKFQNHKIKADGTPRPLKAPKLLKDHICDQCGKGFTTRKDLKVHVQFVHEKIFNIKCDLCGKGWRTWTSLKKHMLSLHPEDPSTKKIIEEEGLNLWNCPVVRCTSSFLQESCLKAHLKRKHGKNEEEIEGLDFLGASRVALEDPSSQIKVTCQKCGKSFSKKSLRDHVKIHENEGKAKECFCETCGKGFVSKKHLYIHVRRVHLKIGVPEGKEFKCEICGKGYKYSRELRGHLEIHEKEGKTHSTAVISKTCLCVRLL